MGPSSGRPILRHLVVAALCASGAAFAASLLLEDFRRPAGQGTGEAMAKVEWLESNVRRKPPTTVLWADVATEDPLFRRDSVRTGSSSQARIKLESGTVVELGENSLIVLEDTEDLSLNTLKGSMIVRGPAGDTKVTVTTDGKKTVEKLPIRLISPDRGKRYFIHEGESLAVKLEWLGSEGMDAESLAIELSDQPGFSRVTRRIQVEPGKNQWSGELPAGRYHWRMVGGDKEARKAAPESVFEVEAVRRPRLIGPTAGEALETLGETGSVQFRWTPIAQAMAYRLEIEGPTPLATGVNGASGFAVVNDLTPGEYRWKLVGERDGFSVESEPAKFILNRAEKLTVALASPDDDEVFEKRPSLRFSWHPPALGGLSYRIRLREKGGESAFFEKTTDSPVMIWENVRPGAFEWEVLAMSESGRTGGSGWRSFAVFEGSPIALTSPEDGNETRYWEDAPEIPLRWKSDPLAREQGVRYRLEVATDHQFDHRVVTRDLGATAASVRELGVPPGTYHWRVLLVDSGERVIKSSASRRFAFGLHGRLAGPVLVSPAENSVLEQLDRARDPVLRWEPVKDARLYRVRVLDKASAKILSELETPEASLTLPGLPEGEFLWTVRAKDPLGREGEFSASHAFRISWGDRVAAPVIASPAIDARTVRWEELANAVTYLVELKRPGEEPARFETDSAGWSVPKELPRGYHSVRVRAKDRFGREGAWSEPADLVLSPEPVIAQNPADGAEIPIYADGASLELDWRRSEGTGRYRTELRLDGNPLLTRESRASKIELPQLSPGTYQWKVTQMVEGPDGKHWEFPSKEFEFEVTRSALARPTGLSPDGEISVGEALNPVVLEWRPVERAEGYVVRIRREDDGPPLEIGSVLRGRSLASSDESVAEKGEGTLQIVTRATRLEIETPRHGEFSWEVRAVASLKGADEYAHPGLASEAEFEFEEEIMGGPAGSGYLAFSTMLAPYTYTVRSPQAGVSGSAASTAMTARLSGEMIMSERWGIGAGVDFTFFQLSGQSFNRTQAEVQAKYRLEVHGGRYPWIIQPKAGVEAREFFELTPADPTGSNVANRNFWSFGPSLGVDVRKQLSKRFSLGAKFGYFLPVALTGLDETASITADASYRNLSFGLQGVYWLGGDWGLAAGGYLENRSISFQPQSTTEPEEVRTDGAYFYGSVIWRF